jgi:hypothetical protein
MAAERASSVHYKQQTAFLLAPYYGIPEIAERHI